MIQGLILFSEKTTNLLVGWLLYPAGDLIGQLLMGKFELERVLVITLIGGLLYRIEIPAYFKLLSNITFSSERIKKLPLLETFTHATEARVYVLNWLGRTLGAMAYFNPLWIARHVFFIYLATHGFHFSDTTQALNVVADCLSVGVKSFLVNLPMSVIGNFVIQTKLPVKYRFLGSASLSALMAISYAIEYKLFR